jgi:hypothetical protein
MLWNLDNVIIICSNIKNTYIIASWLQAERKLRGLFYDNTPAFAPKEWDKENSRQNRIYFNDSARIDSGFWTVLPCSILAVCQYVRRIYCFHYQGWWWGSIFAWKVDIAVGSIVPKTLLTLNQPTKKKI